MSECERSLREWWGHDADMMEDLPPRKENSMTRKDYKLIADAVRKVRGNHRAEYTNRALDALEDLVDELCSACKSDNPRFRENLFRKACGEEEDL